MNRFHWDVWVLALVTLRWREGNKDTYYELVNVYWNTQEAISFRFRDSSISVVVYWARLVVFHSADWLLWLDINKNKTLIDVIFLLRALELRSFVCGCVILITIAITTFEKQWKRMYEKNEGPGKQLIDEE